MARKMGKLSAVGIQKKKLAPGMHSDGGGLYLQVVGDARSWLFRYAVGGKERYCGLGSLNTVSLADARQEAHKCRQIRLAGGDPIETRKAERAANAAAGLAGTTFKEAADTYITSKATGWKNERLARLWRQTLADYAFPIIGALSVPSVTTNHVLKIIEPIWGTKPETAARVRMRIEAVWDSYKARNPETKLGENPARWKGHLDHLMPARGKAKHYVALPYADVGSFMERLRNREGDTSALLEFTILTAVRSGESRGMRVGEIDLAKATWTVPADRMKMGLEHVVPLSPRALEIVRERCKGKPADALVFPNEKGRPFSDMALLMVLRRMDVKATVHGFRSSFRDWAGDCTGFPDEVAEFALAHVKGDAAYTAYRRSTAIEKRRELMRVWADYCAGIAPAGGNVVPMRATV
jgi:integrase